MMIKQEMRLAQKQISELSQREAILKTDLQREKD